MNTAIFEEKTSTTPRTGREPRKRNTARWLIPAGLIFLSLIPAAAGSARLVQLASGAEVTAENARFFAMPLPVIVHIFGALIYSLMGAFQFPQGMRPRPRNLGRHRWAGYVLVIAGLAVALSGLWMSHFYDLPPYSGTLLYIMRWFVGVGMAGSIVVGFFAARRSDIFTHRAWMLRGYALGMGAGTQVFTIMPYVLLIGEPGPLAYALLMGLGWGINLAVAEWVIARRRRRAQMAPASA